MCSCLAALAVAPEVAEQLIYPPTYCAEGVYGVRVWQSGGWRWCVIDDWIPVDGNECPCESSSCSAEFFFP